MYQIQEISKLIAGKKERISEFGSVFSRIFSKLRQKSQNVSIRGLLISACVLY